MKYLFILIAGLLIVGCNANAQIRECYVNKKDVLVIDSFAFFTQSDITDSISSTDSSFFIVGVDSLGFACQNCSFKNYDSTAEDYQEVFYVMKKLIFLGYIDDTNRKNGFWNLYILRINKNNIFLKL